MVSARRFWLRLQTLFRRERAAERLDDEVQFHLEQQIAENIAAGMTREEACHAAMRTFGNSSLLKEETRDAWGWTWLEQFASDLRYGLRTLGKSPGFTAIAVLTLAFGIGTNTAIFSMVNALLLHPYRFYDLDSLVLLWENRGIDEGPDARSISPGDVADLADSQWFDNIATYRCGDFNLSSEGRLDVARGCRVSTNFFSVLGVGPAQGRLFTRDEEQPGSDQSAVLSDGFWQARFAGDRHIVGKT